MPRSPDDTNGLLAALTALQTIAPANTQLAVANAPVYINTHTQLAQGYTTYPAFVIEGAVEKATRLHWSVWHADLQASVSLMDRWDQNRNESLDQIWATLNLDAQRVKANIQDNPTLNVGGVPNARRMGDIRIDGYATKQTQTEGIIVIVQIVTLHFSSLPYVSAA